MGRGSRAGGSRVAVPSHLRGRAHAAQAGAEHLPSWHRLAAQQYESVGDLDFEHVQALRTYTSASGYQVNHAARAGGEDLSPDTRSTLGLLDEAFSRAPRLAEQLVVRREQPDAGIFGGGVGTVAHEAAWLSTSLWSGGTGDHGELELELTLPVGTPVLALDLLTHRHYAGPGKPPVAGPSTFSEHEILLPRGTTWEITQVSPGRVSAVLQGVEPAPPSSVDPLVRHGLRRQGQDQARAVDSQVAQWWLAAGPGFGELAVPTPTAPSLDHESPLHQQVERLIGPVDEQAWRRAWRSAAARSMPRLRQHMTLEAHHGHEAQRELATRVLRVEAALELVCERLHATPESMLDTRDRAAYQQVLADRERLQAGVAASFWEDLCTARPQPLDTDAILHGLHLAQGRLSRDAQD